MSFRVSARTILQLGAELISSDGVAFYELVKNAFDADSRNVEIDVVVRLPMALIEDTVFELGAVSETGSKADVEIAVSKYQNLLLTALDAAAPFARDLLEELEAVGKPEELIALARRANYIEIRDKGSGMSMQELSQIYLTIGTAHRARERAASVQDGKNKRILGEKGIGRLSTMRLGDLLLVRTAQKSDSHWNELEVDWSAFAGADDSKLVSDIHVAPRRGGRKTPAEFKGTHIRISDLAAEWDEQRLRDIAEEEFSKFTDPFSPSKRFPIVATFNGARVSVPHFESILFEHAHAIVTAKFEVGPETEAELFTHIEYRPPGARQPYVRDFSLRGVHLFSAAGKAREHVLRSLGPWELNARWYNRRLLTRIEGIGDLKKVRELLKRWAGVMVFRDGFRVQPYGGPEDDWLGLDRQAFATSGFKLNRNQVVGKVDLSATQNPNLVDQTNREGLRKNREQEAFVELLRTVFLAQLKPFLDEVDRSNKVANTPGLADVVARLGKQDEDLSIAVRDLTIAAPDLRQHPAMLALRQSVEQIKELLEDTNRLAQSYERGQGQLVNLAGIGLTVEILAHELTRATVGALRVLTEARAADSVQEVFAPLQLQLETLSKRLRVLDPLSTAGRQHKTTFDLTSWVQTILDYHKNQFARHGIRHRLTIVPKRSGGEFKVHMVKGMVVQVLENLLSNSVYWLKVRSEYGDMFEPEIRVTLDTAEREIRVWDNGPGIEPSRAETIFIPFNSTKPPNRGKGLGLYVSREIAQYNGGALYLASDPDPRDGMLRTFIFQLPESKDA